MLARRATLAVRAGAAAAGLAAVVAAGLTGCTARTVPAPPIQIGTSYVPVPQSAGTTVAYVVIRNNGAADRLVAARTSAGGRVTFRVARGPSASVTGTVTSVRIPAHATLAMRPNGVQMLITGVGPVRGGKDITLTLRFAHAGQVSVVAQVTNPNSGGSSYLLN